MKQNIHCNWLVKNAGQFISSNLWYGLYLLPDLHPPILVHFYNKFNNLKTFSPVCWLTWCILFSIIYEVCWQIWSYLCQPSFGTVFSFSTTSPTGFSRMLNSIYLFIYFRQQLFDWKSEVESGKMHICKWMENPGNSH